MPESPSRVVVVSVNESMAEAFVARGDLDVRFLGLEGKALFPGNDAPLPASFASVERVASIRLLSRGIGAEDVPWVLTGEDMERLSRFEGLCMEAIGRYDLEQRNFVVNELSLHYYLLANFWAYVLSDERVDACFIGDVPHMPASLVLHCVAKTLGIPSVYLFEVNVCNRFDHLATSLVDPGSLLRSPGTTAPEFLEGFEAYMANIRADAASEAPRYMRTLLRRTGGAPTVGPLRIRLIRVLHSLGRVWQSATRLRTWHRHLPKATRWRWSSPRATYSALGLAGFRLRRLALLAWRRWRYHRRCVPAETLPPYLYFPAHLQPESSTLAGASAARHAFVALQRLSEALPAGHVIAYKENPRTYDNEMLAPADWRPRWFYGEVAALGNVVFVRDDTDTTALIKGSIGVASIRGTATIEALGLGKRAVTFSRMWWDGLDGVHRVDTAEDLRAALELLVAGVPPEPDPRSVGFDRYFFAVREHRHDDAYSRRVAACVADLLGGVGSVVGLESQF